MKRYTLFFESDILGGIFTMNSANVHIPAELCAAGGVGMTNTLLSRWILNVLGTCMGTFCAKKVRIAGTLNTDGRFSTVWKQE